MSKLTGFSHFSFPIKIDAVPRIFFIPLTLLHATYVGYLAYYRIFSRSNTIQEYKISGTTSGSVQMWNFRTPVQIWKARGPREGTFNNPELPLWTARKDWRIYPRYYQGDPLPRHIKNV